MFSPFAEFSVPESEGFGRGAVEMVLIALPADIVLLDGGDESGEDPAELGFVSDIEEVVIKKNATECGCKGNGAPDPEFFL